MKGITLRTAATALLAALLLSLNACTGDGSRTYWTVGTAVEDHSAGYSFPSGSYYSYQFPRPYSSGFDADSLLSRVAESGISISDAWYKSYSANCSRPGDSVVMDVIVEPVLLVRISGLSAPLERFGFIRTASPSTGFCSYAVMHYFFGHVVTFSWEEQ